MADRDRALQRVRAPGIRRGPRAAHRETDVGWAALTPTGARIAVLVREGLTNREIGTRMFVSPRIVQTHVSHILQKTGLRSRVEVARAAGEQIRRLAAAAIPIVILIYMLRFSRSYPEKVTDHDDGPQPASPSAPAAS